PGPRPPGPDPHRGRRARQLPAPPTVLRGRPALRDGGPRHRRWPPSGARDDPAPAPAASWRRGMRAGSSPDLGPSGSGVVRLNRRIIYLVGALLIGATVAALVAIRAQGPRADEDGGHRQPVLQPASHP